jgi:hypothetical protein
MLCHSVNAESIVVLGKSRKIQNLTQANFQKEKTRYIVRYECQLVEDVIIPEHSMLVFQGGLIKGKHRLKGQQTKIESDKLLLFSGEVQIEGSWNVEEAYPEWFGAKGDGINDDTEAIQKTIKLHHVVLSPKTYLVKGVFIGEGSDIEIRGDNSVIKTSSDLLDSRFNVLGNLDMSSRDTSYSYGSFFMSGVTIDGNANHYRWDKNPNPNYYHGLALNNFKKVTIEDCCFKNTLMCGVRLYLCDSVVVKRCTFHHIGTETGHGNNYRTFGSHGWQWEGISLTGWRNINGGAEKVYRRSSLLTVENCKFNTILNSPVGGANVSTIIIKNNEAENLKGGFTEFHIDTVVNQNGKILDAIDSISIIGNYINKNAAGFINFSGPFSSKQSTHINISNNTIDNLYGIDTTHNRASHGSGTRALVVVYPEKVKSKSNIEVLYDNNIVNCSRIGFLKEKLNMIYCTKVKKMTFRNSEFNIHGYDKETVFYTESGDEEISNCTFNFGVNFSQFAIHVDGDFKMLNNKIITSKAIKKPTAVAIFRKTPDGNIYNVEFSNNRINGISTLMYLNAMAPSHVKIINNTIDFEMATLNSVKEQMESLTISGNKAKSNNLNNRHAKKCTIANNRFGN